VPGTTSAGIRSKGVGIFIFQNLTWREGERGMGIDVDLTPQLEELVRSKAASGQYT